MEQNSRKALSHGHMEFRSRVYLVFLSPNRSQRDCQQPKLFTPSQNNSELRQSFPVPVLHFLSQRDPTAASCDEVSVLSASRCCVCLVKVQRGRYEQLASGTGTCSCATRAFYDLIPLCLLRAFVRQTLLLTETIKWHQQ